MRIRSVVLPLLLSTALACGQKPADKKDKKDPLLTKPPTNNTQPVSTPVNPDTAPASLVVATTKPAEPDLASYLSWGVEVEQAKPFSYNFEKGKSASYQVSMRWGLKGVGISYGDFTGTFVADLQWSIKDVDDKGQATIEMTYGRIQLETEALFLGGKRMIDTKSKAQNIPDPYLEPFGKMDGKTLTVKISKEGKIIELVGQDKIIAEALEGSSLPAELKEQIVAAMGEQGLKQVLGQGFLAFPGNELKKGDTFRVGGTDNPLTVPGLGEISIQEDVTMAGLREADGKQQGVFSMEVFANLAASKPFTIKIPGFDVSGEATATIGSGFFVFDLAQGLPLSAEIEVPFDLKNVKLSLPQTGDSLPVPPVNASGLVTVTAKLVE